MKLGSLKNVGKRALVGAALFGVMVLNSCGLSREKGGKKDSSASTNYDPYSYVANRVRSHLILTLERDTICIFRLNGPRLGLEEGRISTSTPEFLDGILAELNGRAPAPGATPVLKPYEYSLTSVRDTAGGSQDNVYFIFKKTPNPAYNRMMGEIEDYTQPIDTISPMFFGKFKWSHGGSMRGL